MEGQKYEANNGLKHLGKIQDLEVEEIKMRYDSELDSLRRELAVEREEREGTSMSVQHTQSHEGAVLGKGRGGPVEL